MAIAKKIYCTALTYYFLSPPLFATETVASVDKTFNTGTLAQLLFSLIIVLSVIILAGWLLKRLNLVSAIKNPFFEVQASISLGARERVVLVKVGDTQLLLGITPQHITCLHQFDHEVSPGAISGTDFSSKLANVLQRGKQ